MIRALTFLPFLLGALSSVLPAPARADSYWFYGSVDNSAAAGVTSDLHSAITWNDGWVSEQQPNTSLGTSPTLQFNQSNLLGQDESILLFGFDGTGINLEEYDVVSAQLYFVVDDCFALGTALSLGVYGINAADSGWSDGTTSGAAWSGKSGAGTGWTGGATLVHHYRAPASSTATAVSRSATRI